MPATNTADRYGHVAQLLHWVVVGLIITQFVLASIIEELPKVQQGIAKMFAGNPITYRMEGSSEMTVTEGSAAPKKTGGTSMMETIVIRD